MGGALVLGLIIGLPALRAARAADPIACVSETGTAGTCVDGTALDGATGVVVSPDGASVYVASETGRSVAIFDRDGATGQISQLPGTQGCISEGGTAGACVDGRAMVGPRGIAVSPDGTNLYFPASGSKAIAVFRRDTTSGQLHQLAGTAGCVSETGTSGACADGTALDGARGVAVSPDGTSVYVAAFFSDAIAVFARDPSTGALTQLAGTAGCISETGTGGACADGAGLDGVRTVAVSPDGTSVYGAAETSGALSFFGRDPATGALTQPAGTAGCVSQSGIGCATGRALGGAADVAVSGDGDHVYVAALASDAVAAFARDPATGALSQLPGQAGCVSETGTNGACADGAALDRARSVALTDDAASVYVGSEISDAVSVFARNPTTGALQQLPGSAGCVSESGSGGACADGVALDGVRSVAVSADGASAYAASFWSSAVSIFVRDPATGALTQPSSTPPPPPPPAEPTILLSLRDPATVGGVSIANEDVVSFADTAAPTTLFDGSDVGLATLRIDAFDRLDQDSLLLSFDQPGSVPGIAGTVDDSDIVRFDATSLGPTTSGAFGPYLDGSDVGLSLAAHDVDALEVLADGRIVLSTTGTASLPAATARDEDLLAFTPTSLGAATSGTFALRFDGSDVGLGDAAEDVDAAAAGASGELHLSTLDAFSVPNITGDDEDIFVFSPTTFDPPTTSGSYASSLDFDGSAFGLAANDVSGVDVP